MFESPLNYTGGKFKLLPQILPHFPLDIRTFVDLFCGGCNVGLNIDCEKIIYNDVNKQLIGLFNTFKNLDKQTIFTSIFDVIHKYGLSEVSRYGYLYYGCESGGGVGPYNKEKFLKLREDFNAQKGNEGDDYYIMLYVMIVYSFNNQIRFNRYGDFNLPVGKRDFNQKMQLKLSEFIERIQEQNCDFLCKDFQMLEIEKLTPEDFVYADPPYLITCAAYNEQGGWTEYDEQDLLRFLDSLTERNIRFALSNVLESKGKTNQTLIEWLETNSSRYKTIHLNYTYSNSNYHTKDRISSSDEVLIINY